MRKLLLVDDNRDAINLGCRATSISLYWSLKKYFKIFSVINKKEARDPFAIGTMITEGSLNQKIIEKIGYRFQKIDPLLKLIGIKKDFIEIDMNRTMNNFFKWREKYNFLNTIYSKISEAELIVINGEGSMIFTSPPRRDLLFQLCIINIAHKLKKPIFYVNAMISDCPFTGRNTQLFELSIETLKKCKLVSARDPISYNIVKDRLNNIDFTPDALFTWFNLIRTPMFKLPSNTDILIPFPEYENTFGCLDFTKPFICLGGSSIIPKLDKYKVIKSYTKLIKALKSLRMPIYIIESCSGDMVLREVSQKTEIPIIQVGTNIIAITSILSSSSLFISGRYHPSIMASLGGTPCIFLKSNSHKTRSLQLLLNYKEIYEYDIILDDETILKIVRIAKEIISQKNTPREKILKRVNCLCEKSSALPKKIKELFEKDSKRPNQLSSN